MGAVRRAAGMAAQDPEGRVAAQSRAGLLAKLPLQRRLEGLARLEATSRRTFAWRGRRRIRGRRPAGTGSDAGRIGALGRIRTCAPVTATFSDIELYSATGVVNSGRPSSLVGPPTRTPRDWIDSCKEFGSRVQC